MAEAAERIYARLLVIRCQARDEAAFEELVERYTPRLRYYLRELLGSEPAADDALQDVWLDAFRALPRLADPGAFAAWIYRLARDRAFRELRRSRRWRPLVEEDLCAEASDLEEFTADDARRVHEALALLLPEHREVLVLRFLEQMPYDDIARVVGCRLGTVRSRLHYAKRALKRILEGGDPDE